ncbi:MAG: hypothetical protein M3O36_05610 [Myxococcota bacterium]|nr:hypothetical protein [Myxococcota bacterium]
MSDAYTFWVGVFTTLWVVLFFGFSARQLRKTYEHPAPGMEKHATKVRRAGL